MRVNDSGMPEEKYWESLFGIEKIISWLNPSSFVAPVIEIGCGYGTFSIPIAIKLKTTLISYDIDSGMIKRTGERIAENNLTNIVLKEKDVIESGLDEVDQTIDAVFMFNILHFSERIALLKEASRVLTKNGKLFVLHWRKDIKTPRGPALEIRPGPSEVIQDALGIGLSLSDKIETLEPYHWGIALIKKG